MGVRIWKDEMLMFETDNIIDLLEYMTVNRVKPKEIDVNSRNDY